MFWRRNSSSSIAATKVEVPISIAVVGLGAMGQRNVAHLVSSPNYRISGVFDVSEAVSEEVAGRIGSQQYSSFEAVLEDDIQAVFICTPHNYLAEFGLRVLESGKHLLVEKPLAIDVDDADRMIALAGEKDLVLSVNYSMAHSRIIQEASSLIAEGVVGDVNSIDIRWNSYKAAGYYQGAHSPSPSDWRLQKSKSGGGMLIMTTCHAMHYAAYLTGATARTASAASQLTDQGGDVEHTLHGLVSYENDISGSISTSSNQRGSTINDTTVSGTHGTMVVGTDELSFFSTRVVSGKRPGRWHKQRFKVSEEHFDFWLGDTARAIDRQAELRVAPELARDTLALIDALYSSAESGLVVDVGGAS